MDVSDRTIMPSLSEPLHRLELGLFTYGQIRFDPIRGRVSGLAYLSVLQLMTPTAGVPWPGVRNECSNK